MKQKKTLTYFLLLGSLFMTLSFYGCNLGNTDYVFCAYWTYINNSDSDIIIDGYTHFSLNKTDSLKLPIGSSKNILFDELGGKELVPAEGYPMPKFKKDVQIIIDEKKYTIPDNTYFRDRNNYLITRINKRTYRFTYRFTDEILSQLMDQEYKAN